MTEGDTGTINATFTVTLRGERPDRHGRLRDRERHRDGPADYTGGDRHAHLHPGRDDEDRHRVVNGDLLDEANETFIVNLTNPTNATIADGQGVGTITDDDPRRRSRSTTSRSPRATRHHQRDLHRHPHLAERPQP